MIHLLDLPEMLLKIKWNIHWNSFSETFCYNFVKDKFRFANLKNFSISISYEDKIFDADLMKWGAGDNVETTMNNFSCMYHIIQQVYFNQQSF